MEGTLSHVQNGVGSLSGQPCAEKCLNLRQASPFVGDLKQRCCRGIGQGIRDRGGAQQAFKRKGWLGRQSFRKSLHERGKALASRSSQPHCQSFIQRKRCAPGLGERVHYHVSELMWVPLAIDLRPAKDESVG